MTLEAHKATSQKAAAHRKHGPPKDIIEPTDADKEEDMGKATKDKKNEEHQRKKDLPRHYSKGSTNIALLRSAEEARASAEQQQKQPPAAVVKAENQPQQQPPARPHRATEKEKGKAPAAPESPRQQQKPQAQQQPTELQKLVAAARPELPRIQTQLSRKEKEEDFLAMKGTKLPVRPKRRPKAVEKNVSMIYPGQWLSEVSRTRYMVREKKSRKEKRKGGGLKAMESDSD